MKYLCLNLLFIGCALMGHAQIKDTVLLKKNLPDSILSPTRVLSIPEPFDAAKALGELFPGRRYKMKDDDVINWECRTCATKDYEDVNEDNAGAFPYKEGVATRVINVVSYKDSTGTEYKMLAFNHSVYDKEGMQTSRFTGGLLGLAKFALVDKNWVLKYYQPAVAAYGSFAQCPPIHPLVIGHDQYAFIIKSVNGGAPGPYDGSFYMLVGTGGAYKQLLVADDVIRTKSDDDEGLCSWESEYTCPESDKRFFRDVIVTMKGIFKATDTDGMPDAIKPLIKGKKSGKFTIVQRYVFKGNKGYVLQLPVQASVE
jgi:hypothetical protein